MLTPAAVAHADGISKIASVQDYLSLPRHTPEAVVHYGPAPAQVAELFLPKNPKTTLPVVVLLHGGCFLEEYQGLPQTSAMAAALAAEGYAVWNLDYRKLGEPGAGYPGTFQDVASGIDRLREEAPRYGMDLTRVIAVGHSAGGHLALWAAARSRLPRSSPLHAADPLKIKAVVALAGIGDLERQAGVWAQPCGDSIPRLIAGADPAAPYADTSPAALLPTGVPINMVHGAFDHVMPPYTGRDYALRAQAAGDQASVTVIPGAGHFDVVTPGTSAWTTVSRVIGEAAGAPR